MKAEIKDGNLILTPESKFETVFLFQLKTLGVQSISEIQSWNHNGKDTIIVSKKDDGW